MLSKKETPVVAFALLLALASVPEPFVHYLDPVLAQAPSSSPFTIPSVVPKDSKIRVDGSTSMKSINAALKQGYEKKYDGATVDFAYSGTAAAIQSLLDGKIDLAAIGRSLTDEEKAKGLKEVRVARHKIAMIIGPDNPFRGSLKDSQFAQIFRGEIKNWSEVGGAPGAIRFIDRVADSDTRQSFRNYPVFKSAPFQTGAGTIQLNDDNTETVLKELGRDGISYAIADQVFKQPGVQVVSMHQTLPDDPRYPFSQPLVYVYKDTPPAAVAAFLGVATAPENAALIEEARKAGAIAAATGSASLATASPTVAASPLPSPAATPDATAAVPPPAAAATDNSLSPWWLLLPLALLGLAAWWFGRRGAAPGTAGGAGVPGVAPATGATAPGAAPVNPGPGATGVPPATGAVAGAVPPVADSGVAAAIPPIPPADQPISTGVAAAAAGLGAAGLGAAAIAGLAGKKRSQITLTPRDAHQAYANWDAPAEHKAEVQAQGGQNMLLRLYDVTGLDAATAIPEQFEDFDVADWSSDRNLPIPAYDRDYVAEVGYVAGDGRWLPMARSNSIRVAPPNFVEPETAAGAGIGGLGAGGAVLGAAALAGAGAAALGALAKEDPQSGVEATKYDVGQTDLSSEELAKVDEGLPGLPDGYGESRIVLMPRDPQWGYTYWDTPDHHKQELRHQGGQRLALRIYDVTDVDINSQAPHSLQQYDCDELARDWYVRIPVSDRDYIAEIGYLTGDGRWLMLARSAPCRIPPVYPSDWSEDVFATVDWDEDLQGKTIAELVPPSRKLAAGSAAIYDQIFGMSESAEAMRVAGSLFGSMQHVPGSVFGSMQMVSGQTVPGVSSYIFASGVGMGVVPTMSGLTMSGIGFAASMPPIRARKFWLVADAELIIYGATEPDATVTIGGRPIQLNPDGTFRFQMSFQDGLLDFPIMAVAADGEQNRSIHMKFVRETPARHTNTKDEAQDEEY